VIRLTIPGAPQGKGRPRIGKVGQHARMFTPAKTVAYEGLVAHAAQVAMAGAPPLQSAVGCNVFIDCQVPASWSGKKQRAALAGEVLPESKPDADNVVKAIFDGLNGVLWRDDVLVVDLRVRKRYAATPCVRVEVWAQCEPVQQGQLLGAAA
jgi:Holliday junction resolvase RusA-like endonuclease